MTPKTQRKLYELADNMYPVSAQSWLADALWRFGMDEEESWQLSMTYLHYRIHETTAPYNNPTGPTTAEKE
ncbi:MAG TPA: hypothetical protein VFK47_05120 [Ktedonobacteraceae bacterium]|nr:hypothetical protein [Ktedonobacteraceae bacterium]